MTAIVPISRDKLNYQPVIFTLGVIVIGFALLQRVLILSVKVLSVIFVVRETSDVLKKYKDLPQMSLRQAACKLDVFT